MKAPFFKNKKEKLPEALKKGLLPDEKTINQGKTHFMAAFDTSELSKASSAPVRQGFSFAWVFKIGIGVMTVVAIIAGTSAYADTANVSVNSPLYPLKRLGENVQLALAPAQDKAQLETTLADRRLNEIDELRATHPSSTLIAKLANDANQDVSSSLTIASDSSLTAKPLTTFCFVFSGRLGVVLATHPDLLARFNAKCGSESSSTLSLPATVPNDQRRTMLENILRGTSTDETSTISSTIEMSSTIIIHEDPGKHIISPPSLPKLPEPVTNSHLSL